jgi:hypothetical protein
MGVLACLPFRLLYGGLGKDREVQFAYCDGNFAHLELFVPEKAPHDPVHAEKAAPPVENRPFTQAHAATERGAF